MVHDGGLDRFLPWRKVHDITGLGRTTAWRLRRAGDFPHPVPISPGRVAWRERDIALWNETRGTPSAMARAPVAAVPPRPTRRAPQTQVIDSAPPPLPPLADPPRPMPELARQRRPRRPDKAIAEGQLGFDF
ncbi:hypothetical protein BZG35_17055 [Brevundimonas sp. LM2]|uniref:helix-turn-helix transcriptional regulator n=1 Tax=Brevundimonas sp. LM2 TaxID=1938605 RepID=UPI0009838CB8|nr:AlpA family phage regulatory protein [Brevundimonas sp. LM2]AQR63164.1 hypothetical protein BZG35_17055 [Brevundimonas sp. LM2]